MDNKQIKYFGFGTNRDKEMMEHMIGRQSIKGEPGRLLDFEFGIVGLDNFRNEIPKTSPIKLTPRQLVQNGFGDDFRMFVSRPKKGAVTYGTIWTITTFELDLVREWEMVEYGAQEDAKGIAVNEKGEQIEVITQSFLREPSIIDEIITGSNYEDYIAPKEVMLKRADEVRQQYIKLLEDLKNKKPL